MIACGLDIGSTNVKAVLAGEDGRTLWVKSVPTPRADDGLGVTTDATALITLLEELIIEGWRAVGGGKPLAAISSAGVGEDGVCANQDLSSRGLVIAWFDKRAMAEVARFRAAFHFTRVDFHTSAAKWMWMRRHRADEIGGARLWIALADYCTSLWCGAPFMSETLAARTGCYDLINRCWSAEALSFAEAPPLPRVLKTGEIAGTAGPGRLREAGAVSSATLMVAGGHDHPIASSAILRLNPLARIDSLGTANAIYGETRALNPAVDESLEATVPAMCGPGLAVVGVTEFALTLEKHFGKEAIRTILALPRLPGPPDPKGDDEPSRIRLVLEEMALRGRGFLRCFDRAGVPRGVLYATGGWARSAALMELRASVFREPITVVAEPELVGLGAALLGLEAATGAPASFTPEGGVHVVDPLGRWAEAYAGL
ncbi:FGGY family carbohydrate kinase [Aestuariivirga sp.]|uniref:FGGY family carbohydrate kinase n=1 Tax=Aestuariivirga sp. TaxID=2650926 RepID=UPI003BA963DE